MAERTVLKKLSAVKVNNNMASFEGSQTSDQELSI